MERWGESCDLRYQRGVILDPTLCHRRVFGVELEQYCVAAKPIGDKARGSGAAKRIEDYARPDVSAAYLPLTTRARLLR